MYGLADNSIGSLISEKHITGAAVAWGDVNQTHMHCTGFVDELKSHPIDGDTLFDIQSITKTVFAVPLLQLYQQTLDLNHLVSDLIPTFSKLDMRKESVQLIDLINHNSGLSDQSLDFPWISVDDAWTRMITAGLFSQPKTEIEYADINYRLLGKIIEMATGKDLRALLHAHRNDLSLPQAQFAPLNTQENKNVACPASKPFTWGQVDDEQDRLLGGALGCDGLFCSLNDLATFSRSLLKNEKRTTDILKHKALTKDCEESNPYLSLGTGSKALGWEVHSLNNSYCPAIWSSDSTIEKAGGGGAFLSLNLKTKQFFIYLTNFGRPEPFTEESWNNLVRTLSPRRMLIDS